MCPSLDPWELEEIQVEIADSLPDTCDLLTTTYTPDGMGGFSTVAGTVYANMPCRLDVVKSLENVAGAGKQPFTTFMLTLPHNAVITTAYQVKYKSTIYNVTGITPERSWSACKRVTIEKAV